MGTHLQLRLIRVRSGVCHAEDASAGVRQMLLELVHKLLLPNGIPSSPGASRIATLNLQEKKLALLESTEMSFPTLLKAF